MSSSRFGRATPIVLQPLAVSGDATTQAASPAETPATPVAVSVPVPELPVEPGSHDASLSALLERAKGARKRKDSQNAPVEAVTCVFSVETKRRIQDAAGADGKSVARWIAEAFQWCYGTLTARELADLAALVAEERNAKSPDGTSCRASGTGVPIRGEIYAQVASYAKSVRPRISHAALLEAAAVARLSKLAEG